MSPPPNKHRPQSVIVHNTIGLLSLRFSDHASGRSDVASLHNTSLLLAANNLLLHSDERAAVAAPRQEAVRDGVTADVVLVSDFSLLHELDDPSQPAAELETTPCHALLRC